MLNIVNADQHKSCIYISVKDHMYMYIAFTVEPLIKDTLNKGHLCIKDTFQCTNLYSGNTFLPLKEDNLSIMDKMIRPNVSVIQRFHCILHLAASMDQARLNEPHIYQNCTRNVLSRLSVYVH